MLVAWVAAPAGAQAPQVAPVSLAVVVRVDAGNVDPGALRSALSSELRVPVELVGSASAGQAHLVIEGSRLEQLRVAFVRADGSSVERSLDLSSMRNQASEALALLAANLTRDEAAELLARMRPAEAAPPQPPAADAEQPPRLQAKPPLPPRPPKKMLPRGCDPRPRLEKRSFGFDVVPHVGTTGREPTRVERNLSFNLIGGLSGATRGLELATTFNIDVEGTCGLQLSGVINIDAGSTEGLQLGEINWTGGRLDGVQLGLVSITKDDIVGAQLGLVNLGAGELSGAQLGLVNLAVTGVYGAQLGLVNVDAERVEGAQLGLVNTARVQLHGAQLGLVNLSADVQGAQLGLVNVSSGTVNGATIGLLNVAQDAAAPIGLINVLWRGTTNLDIWGSDAGFGLIAIRHGGRYIHNFYGVGGSSRDDRFVFASALGLGVTLYRGQPIFVDLDLIGYSMITRVKTRSDSSDDRFRYGTIAQLRLPVGWQITPGFAVFLSPALNVSIVDREDNPLEDPSLLGSQRLTNGDAKVAVRIWPGFTAGLRFF